MTSPKILSAMDCISRALLTDCTIVEAWTWCVLHVNLEACVRYTSINVFMSTSPRCIWVKWRNMPRVCRKLWFSMSNFAPHDNRDSENANAAAMIEKRVLSILTAWTIIAAGETESRIDDLLPHDCDDDSLQWDGHPDVKSNSRGKFSERVQLLTRTILRRHIMFTCLYLVTPYNHCAVSASRWPSFTSVEGYSVRWKPNNQISYFSENTAFDEWGFCTVMHSAASYIDPQTVASLNQAFATGAWMPLSVLSDSRSEAWRLCSVFGPLNTSKN